MTFTTDSRKYFFKKNDGSFDSMVVNYKIWWKGGSIVDIRNEHHHSVERTSDCWDYFTKKNAKHV